MEVRNDGGEFFFMNEKFFNFNKLEIGKVERFSLLHAGREIEILNRGRPDF